MTDPILPDVHLNGTNRDDLIDLRCNVLDALRDVDKALAAMAPNGRDYYTTPGKMTLAENQHRDRQNRLKALIDDLTREVEMIADL